MYGVIRKSFQIWKLTVYWLRNHITTGSEHSQPNEPNVLLPLKIRAIHDYNSDLLSHIIWPIKFKGRDTRCDEARRHVASSALLLRQDTCSGHPSDLEEGICELVSKFNMADQRIQRGCNKNKLLVLFMMLLGDDEYKQPKGWIISSGLNFSHSLYDFYPTGLYFLYDTPRERRKGRNHRGASTGRGGNTRRGASGRVWSRWVLGPTGTIPASMSPMYGPHEIWKCPLPRRQDLWALPLSKWKSLHQVLCGLWSLRRMKEQTHPCYNDIEPARFRCDCNKFLVLATSRSINNPDRPFSPFETVTGSRIKTIVILWHAQACRIRPLQIYNNFRIAWLFQKNIASSH